MTDMPDISSVHCITTMNKLRLVHRASRLFHVFILQPVYSTDISMLIRWRNSALHLNEHLYFSQSVHMYSRVGMEHTGGIMQFSAYREMALSSAFQFTLERHSVKYKQGTYARITIVQRRVELIKEKFPSFSLLLSADFCIYYFLTTAQLSLQQDNPIHAQAVLFEVPVG